MLGQRLAKRGDAAFRRVDELAVDGKLWSLARSSNWTILMDFVGLSSQAEP